MELKLRQAKIGQTQLGLGALALAAVVAVPFGASIYTETSIPTALAQTSDALQRFVGRSPGERGATDDFKDKGKGKAGALALGEEVAPGNRALGKVFDDAPEQAIQQLAQTPAVPQTAPGATLPIADVASVATPAAVGPGPVVLGGPGGALIPILGAPALAAAPDAAPGGTPIGDTTTGGTTTGGTTTGGTTTGGTTTGGVIAAVPEPQTWAMMIMGFGLIGAAMRRRKHAGLAGAAAASKTLKSA